MAVQRPDIPPIEIPRRADARRNRELVLEAAAATFAQDGIDAPMSDVAARAGLGVGTVYRHFPGKEDLLAALAARHIGRLAAIADEELEATGPPGERLERLLLRAARLNAGDAALSDLVWNQLPDDLRAGEAERRLLHERAGELVALGVAAGELRPDATAADIQPIMCGLGAVLQRGAGDWERYMRIALDGLRAGARRA